MGSALVDHLEAILPGRDQSGDARCTFVITNRRCPLKVHLHTLIKRAQTFGSFPTFPIEHDQSRDALHGCRSHA
jgi:hypothetical protein